ncbi:DNA repair protein RecO [Thorsellia anophelis]|uniref:DNA repair protein RecO n=1 Tax=Thorsellia anophelis DSM 18579 TaxID=1123402 RepID=A0A1I0C0X8_9GAMM|nr:DNA repair protein RecO [Thorsellia anophelis]SET12508.1 DNA replication and repair protein RecO [Thorsellia anophelis DSM 18579]
MTEIQNAALSWQRAFVLHSKPFSESSLLVSLFCEKQGSVTVLAKGARSRRSPQKGNLQPFTPLLVRYTGKGEVKTLTGIEAISLSLPLSTTYLYSGFYLNELILRVLEHNTDCSELFLAYLNSLQQLALQADHIESILRRFELTLLKHLGYGVDFLHCAGSGQPVSESMSYIYYPEKGFIASLMKKRESFTGYELLALANQSFPDELTRLAAKRFTRMALRPYIGSKPLKSRELFTQQFQ